MTTPKIIDNDRDEITAQLGGKEIRGWSYKDRDEFRTKMKMAREFVEGYYQCQRAKERLCEELADALEGFLDHSTSSYCEFCDSHAPKDDAGDLTDVVRHKTDCPVVTANTLLTKAGRTPK